VEGRGTMLEFLWKDIKTTKTSVMRAGFPIEIKIEQPLEAFPFLFILRVG
jgi:hypothetical protein